MVIIIFVFIDHTEKRYDLLNPSTETWDKNKNVTQSG